MRSPSRRRSPRTVSIANLEIRWGTLVRHHEIARVRNFSDEALQLLTSQDLRDVTTIALNIPGQKHPLHAHRIWMENNHDGTLLSGWMLLERDPELLASYLAYMNTTSIMELPDRRDDGPVSGDE